MGRLKSYDIKLNKRHLDIIDSLHRHLENELKNDKFFTSGHYYDDYYDEDDYDLYYPTNVSFDIYNKKKNKNRKRGSRGSKKNNSLNKLRSRFNFSDTYDDDDYKVIYYYRDINNPDDCCEFTNLNEFEEFLKEEGIKLSTFEAINIMNRCVSHCCINPSDRLSGELNLITDSSYGSLVYECSEYENIMLIK